MNTRMVGESDMDVTVDWYWEGNVVKAIARFLAQDGWTIVSKADTHSKKRGVDIQATRHGQTLLLEAKGYPSKNYRDPRRAAEVKPTNPTNRLAGKQKLPALGSYPDVSLADAGTARDQAKGLLADGIDPCRAKQLAKISAEASANSSEAVVKFSSSAPAC